MLHWMILESAPGYYFKILWLKIMQRPFRSSIPPQSGPECKLLRQSGRGIQLEWKNPLESRDPDLDACSGSVTLTDSCSPSWFQPLSQPEKQVVSPSPGLQHCWILILNRSEFKSCFNTYVTLDNVACLSFSFFHLQDKIHNTTSQHCYKGKFYKQNCSIYLLFQIKAVSGVPTKFGSMLVGWSDLKLK